jgi:hypothetical protein
MSSRLFSPTRVFLLATLVLATAHTPAFARVGEPLAKLKKHFDTSPERESPKNMAIWFIESIDGALVYTATFNSQGLSISEGIKPLKRAVLTAKIAEDFIQDQMVPLQGSTTSRVVPPGQTYLFAGQSFVCGESEFVMVDDERGLLLIWSRGGIPSVMAISREMLLPPNH